MMISATANHQKKKEGGRGEFKKKDQSSAKSRDETTKRVRWREKKDTGDPFRRMKREGKD